MKNYLFAPFKDDEDKMSTWESCKSGIDQGIMIFLGRLESTYDVIISELRSKNAVAVADERIIKTLEKEIRVLKADNKESMEWIEQYKLGQSSFIDKIDKLKAEIKTLKADYDNDIKASYELDDKHVEIIKTLETEKDALLVANGELLQSNIKLRSE